MQIQTEQNTDDHVSPNDFEPFSLAISKWNLSSRNQLVNEFPLARNLSRHGCRDMRVIEANETENISRSWRKE